MTLLLEVDDVSIAFGGLHALSNVALRVEEGTIVGLIGPNGAGKTTLFNIVSGLQAPDTGTIKLDGRNLTHTPVHQRAGLGIGRSFQNLGLIDDETVLTNLLAAQHLTSRYHALDALARPWRWRRSETTMRTRAEVAAEAVGLHDQLSTRVEDLSFGKARFTELACVLVHDPRLMLLDEPTTGLDMSEIDVLLELLRAQQQRGTTILLVAHDVRFVMSLCDHVYVLSEGRVLADGSPEDVQRDPVVVEAYLGKAA